MSLDNFHPATRAWFLKRFGKPTEVQDKAWPAIAAGQHTLIAAPTGSGKTLAAFLAVIDGLVAEGVSHDLPVATRVLYVSPLKALSNDIEKNLQEPLNGIADELERQGFVPPAINAAVRTGDTPQSQRARMRKSPPHILVTTPESLYILLTSDSGREMLATVSTVIVDEIHALAGNKRGAHLALSLERLAALVEKPLTRIGVSATQRPIERMAKFLIGNRKDDCNIIDTGFIRPWDLQLELPKSPLQAVMPGEVWSEIYKRIAALAEDHSTTLVFVNTRRLAERAARALAEHLGEELVTAHHGSLSREHRLQAEQRLKSGSLRILVATASLELGIDIGDVDLVCQLGSPRTIAAFLQRVGRSGHGVDGVPKGRLFPLSRDELVESIALLNEVRSGRLDQIRFVTSALDVLAQQITADVAMRDWSLDDLYLQVCQADPYRDLPREQFDAVVNMLADGFSTRRGRRSAHLHLDAVNRIVRGRRGARLTAITNGGAIPDQFDYDVVMLPEELRVGTLNEDFAFESLPGDIFQLGNMSYRILRVETGRVLVEDAHGQPPNIPFWFGEAPGRSDELSSAVSKIREEIDSRLDEGMPAAIQWLQEECCIDTAAAIQLVDYLATAKAALGVIPIQKKIVFERFFDEMGDMHLVIHSPYGSRLNRAWGLALRKRFCRKFNFELQAAALEDSIVLSLGPTHSFPLDEVKNYLQATGVEDVLVQALLAAPMFPTHWRWNATIALAVRRFNNGRKQPPQFQRSDAEDLIAVIFPDQLACAENITTGYREIPEHPLVQQTIDDCLHELMDVGGLRRVLTGIANRKIEIICRDLAAPSPLAQEIINARPYAFLDDAPAEERRTQAVRSRHLLTPEDAADIGRLDAAAIDQVREEAWPDPRNCDEVHDALVLLGYATQAELLSLSNSQSWASWLQELAAQNRATRIQYNDVDIWVAAERLGQLQLLFPEGRLTPEIKAVLRGEITEDAETALREIIRSRLEGLGPILASRLAAELQLPLNQIEQCLLALEIEGFVMRGRYSQGLTTDEWCERRLLARINRYTVKRLRSEIDPVSPAVYMRFLFDWHGLGEERGRGVDALTRSVEQLEGFAAPAAAWESALLPTRVLDYIGQDLDQLMGSGLYTWERPHQSKSQVRSGPVSSTPIVLLSRAHRDAWAFSHSNSFSAGGQPSSAPVLSGKAERMRAVLEQRGASFFADLLTATGMLRTEGETALGELVAAGFVTADSFRGLRELLRPAEQKRKRDKRHARRASYRVTAPPSVLGLEGAGRWSLTLTPDVLATDTSDAKHGSDESALRYVAMALLRRYGVVFRAALTRELKYLPPWRDLVRVYRRMEAAGEIRGGRFVTGFSGEQFALPDAVRDLRRARKAQSDHSICISAVDPPESGWNYYARRKGSSIHSESLVVSQWCPSCVVNARRISLARET